MVYHFKWTHLAHFFLKNSCIGKKCHWFQAIFNAGEYKFLTFLYFGIWTIFLIHIFVVILSIVVPMPATLLSLIWFQILSKFKQDRRPCGPAMLSRLCNIDFAWIQRIPLAIYWIFWLPWVHFFALCNLEKKIKLYYVFE